MKSILNFALPMLLIAAGLSGCYLLSSSQYYISTERSSESVVSNVIDGESGAPIVEIAAYSGEAPSVRVFPVTETASSTTFSDNARVEYSESDSMNIHAVGFENPARPMPLSLSNIDIDRDGVIDARVVMLPMGAGFTHYFDLDANGVLDAYNQVVVEGAEKVSTRAILLEQRWVPVENRGELLDEEPPTATTLEAPAVTYEFRAGAWQAIESTPSPE